MKEEIINNVVIKAMEFLNKEESEKVKNILYMELYNIDLVRKETALVKSANENTTIVKKFIACKKVQGLSERSMSYYLYEYRDFFRFINKNMSDITPDDIRYYLSYCQNRRTVSNTTLDNKRRCLSTLFTWAFNETLISINPTIKIPAIKKSQKVRKPFTELEIEKMRSELNFTDKKKSFNYKNEVADMLKMRNIAIFELLLSTGCRVGEVVRMNRTDLNLIDNEIIVLGKGNKERKVFLNAKSVTALQRYLKCRKDTNEALFVGVSIDLEYSRLEIAGIEIMIRELGKKAGVENAHPHRFRRTAATQALEKGMPIEQVQVMLGHSTISTTQIYTTVKEKEVKRSHEKYFN